MLSVSRRGREARIKIRLGLAGGGVETQMEKPVALVEGNLHVFMPVDCRKQRHSLLIFAYKGDPRELTDRARLPAAEGDGKAGVRDGRAAIRPRVREGGNEDLVG